MKIAISNPEILFGIFYVLAFLVSIVILLYGKTRQNRPLTAGLLLMATVTLLTIVGSKFFSIPVKEWGSAFFTGNYADYHGRSAIGGLSLGLAGLALFRRVLRVNTAVFNIYAWIIPLAFGIQQIGCFLNGCCFGRPSQLPWSVSYPVGSNAHYFQWFHGMIGENATYSMHVHPVQIYESLCLFIIAFIVWRTRKIWKKSSSNLILSISIYLIVKFFLDFFRESSLSDFASHNNMEINLIQWIELFSGVVCGAFLYFHEKSHFKLSGRILQTNSSVALYVTYCILLSLLIYVLRGWFEWYELIALDLIFVPAILLTAALLFRSLTFARIRIAAASFLVFPLTMVFQSLPQDTATQRQTIRSFYRDEVKSYKRIDFGISAGSFYSEMKYNPHEGDCGTVYTTDDYKHVFRMGGISYSKVLKEDNLITTMGLDFFGGVNSETLLATGEETSYFLFGVGPYVKYDWRWIGVGMGLKAGNLRWVPIFPLDESTHDSGSRFFPIMPEGSLRFGRQDILDIRYNYGFSNPTAYPVLTHEVSIGSGFSLKPDYSFRFGGAMSSLGGHFFISAETLVHQQVGLNIRYNWGNSIYANESYYDATWIQLSANYRFSFKK